MTRRLRRAARWYLMARSRRLAAGGLTVATLTID